MIVQEDLQNSQTKRKNTEGAASSTPVHDSQFSTWGIHIVMRSFNTYTQATFPFRRWSELAQVTMKRALRNHRQRNYEKSVGELLQPPDGMYHYERQS